MDPKSKPHCKTIHVRSRIDTSGAQLTIVMRNDVFRDLSSEVVGIHLEGASLASISRFLDTNGLYVLS